MMNLKIKHTKAKEYFKKTEEKYGTPFMDSQFLVTLIKPRFSENDSAIYSLEYFAVGSH